MSSQGLLTRKLQQLNSNWTMGCSFPKELVEKSGKEPGDDVSIQEIDQENRTITFKL